MAVAPGVGSTSMSWIGEEGRGGKSRGDSNEDRTGLGASVEDDGPGWGLVVVALLSIAHDAGVLDHMEQRSGDLGCMAWTYASFLGAMGPCILWGDLKRIPN